MTVYHVETQENYDALMIELEDKGCKWRGWEKLADIDESSTHGKDTYVYEECCRISISSVNFLKAYHSDKTPIEYKAKGENMTQENKHNLQKIAFDVSVAIESFARDISESEADLQEAKTSAKKLIEKIDEYLEFQKPKFKVGDYAVELGKYITKIEKNDDGMPKGCFYMPGNNHFSPIKDSVSSYIARYATPEEIEEYEVALTFHKHGRKPFEVKRGDVVYLKRYDKNIFLDSGNIYKKHNFIDGDVVFVKTAEEVNEWL